MGFSILKLIFTIIAVIAAWRCFKWVARISEARGATAKGNRRARASGGSQTKPSASNAVNNIEEMIKCRVCGVFVAAQNPASCGGDDCPYRS